MSAPAVGQIVHEDLKMLAFDGAAGDTFGESIAINDGVVVIGAMTDDDNGINSGSAYIMHLILDVVPIKLLANDGASGDLFGYSVAIGPGIIGPTPSTLAVVGAPNDSDLGSSSGSAYLFNLTGVQYLKLLPNDGALGDNFGVSVAIDNGIVVVGAPEDDDNGTDSGSVYLFDAASGSQLMKLTPNDGAPNDGFGYAVAISNGLVAVSSVRDQNNGIMTGSVYLFSASNGAPLGKILSNEGIPLEGFGASLALDNGIAAIGASGTAVAYVYDTSTLARISKLTPSIPGNSFGLKIAIDGNKVVITAPSDPVNGLQSGSAFLFNGMNGTELANFVPSDGAYLDQFGWSVGIHNDMVVIGARLDDDSGFDSGSAYFFDIYCPADINGDGAYNFLDVSAFLAAYSNDQAIADFNHDNVLNFLDISAFLAAYTAGCP